MSNAEAALSKPDPQALTERDQRGNIARLTIAQALVGANSVVVYATGGIVGHALAPDKTLATLPISIFVIGMVACTLPMGAVARRYGRRIAFLTGTASGVLVGLLAAAAVVLTSFWLFCLATFFGGVYAAVVLSFRFAAADGVMPQRTLPASQFRIPPLRILMPQPSTPWMPAFRTAPESGSTDPPSRGKMPLAALRCDGGAVTLSLELS